MKTSKTDRALSAEIKRTEGFLLCGEITVTEAAKLLLDEINEANWKYTRHNGDPVNTLSAYHKAFAMLARVTKN